MKFLYLFITLTIVFATSEQLNIKSTIREARQVDIGKTKDYETNPFLSTELEKKPDETPEVQVALGINPENPFLQEYISNTNKEEKKPSKRNPIINAEDDVIQDKTLNGKTLFLSPTIEETLQRKQEFLQKLQESTAPYTSTPIKSSEEAEEEDIQTSAERAPSLNAQYSSRESSSQPTTPIPKRTQQSPFNDDNSEQIQIIRNPDNPQQYTINSNLRGQIRNPSSNSQQFTVNPDNDSQQIQYTRVPIKFQTNSNENTEDATEFARIPINAQQFAINSNDNQGQFTRIPVNSQQFSLNSNNPGVLQFLGGNNQGGSTVIQSDQESGNIFESIIRNTILTGTDVFLGGILNGNGNSNQQEAPLGGNRIVLSQGSNFFGSQQGSEQFVLPNRVVTTQQIVGRPERIVRPNNIAFPQEQRVQLFEG